MPMLAKQTVSMTGTAGATTETTVGAWIPVNIHDAEFKLGFGVVVNSPSSGNVTYRVEHTFDNVFDPSVTPVPFTHEDVSAATVNADGNYAYGIRALRLALTQASAATSVTLTVVQPGF